MLDNEFVITLEDALSFMNEKLGKLFNKDEIMREFVQKVIIEYGLPEKEAADFLSKFKISLVETKKSEMDID